MSTHYVVYPPSGFLIAAKAKLLDDLLVYKKHIDMYPVQQWYFMELCNAAKQLLDDDVWAAFPGGRLYVDSSYATPQRAWIKRIVKALVQSIRTELETLDD